ncbi:glycosyltransferase [Butyrivibrio sp. YAB3001]|uniref:glycosyltransferase n=1 Tax=Butyrivibrio sp. YAB3001 TaxID=1520812 RepID=UPI0008F664B6|nr:glycosyltransferase [Butyrivibrio sp. YAB3001]SFC76718.1 Glycosyltransferase involved in cell wall bisynthesis [Butyrivibrio sp. YAB3001]
MNVDKNNKKMHIAMYIGSLQKGGAERVMVNLAQFFHSQGHKITLVTTYLASEEYQVEHAAWKVVPAGKEGGILACDTDENPVWVDPNGGEKGGIDRVFSALLKEEQKSRAQNLKLRSDKLKKIWKDINPDIILSFIGKNNIMALSTATKEGYKVVVSVRADPHMEYDTVALKSGMLATFGKAAGVVVQTTDAAKFFPPFIRKKCFILPNSINPSFIRPRYVGDREKSIVMVGRLDSNKNQALVIKAFSDIIKSGKFKDYKLKLFGDGPDKAMLREITVTEGIEKYVEFAGTVEHVAEHIEKTSLFILASYQEGMPNALLEAMSLGLPCISTDCPCGGPKDIINNNENGILVPVGDRTAMKKAILKVIQDSQFAERIGRNATYVQNKFSPDAVNRQWERYFEKIVKNNR